MLKKFTQRLKHTKRRVKIHNDAVQQFKLLVDEITKDCDLCDSVLAELLQNDDMDIRHSAASLCLKFNIHIVKAEEILEHISKTGHRMASMGAKRALKIWRGEIRPDEPG